MINTPRSLNLPAKVLLLVPTFLIPGFADLVPGFDQRYASGDYIGGVWADSGGSADATASDVGAFIATTTPNGAAAIENFTDGAVMDFDRASALGSAGSATVQTVIRIDASDDDRKGPFALDQANGWSGLYMGANADGSNSIRGGNVGDTGGAGTSLNTSGGASVAAGTWGVYTLVIDGTQNSNPQLSATFQLLSDLSTVFSVDYTNGDDATAATLGLGTSGVLYGGERGGGASATSGWEGAIADLVVYDSALNQVDLNANLLEFQSLYQEEEVVETGIAAGLLSYWAFEDDLSDSAHANLGASSQTDDQGTWVGSSAFDTGRVGRGITLTGSEYVSIADSADLNRTDSDLTISAWMRVDNWDVSWQALLAKGEGNAYRIARSSGGDDAIAYAGGAGDVSGGAVNDGAWHHVLATTVEGGEVSLWIDGINVNSGSGPASIDNDGNGSATPLFIGANPQASTLRNWIGGIDEVAIWDRVLSTAEIAYLANGHPLLADPFLSVDSTVQLAATTFNLGPVQRSIPISNVGSSQTLNISNVALGGSDASSFTINTYPSTLAPGAQGEILVTFSPLAQGSYDVTLTIDSNSEDSASKLVAVQIDALPDLVDGVTFRVYQANRSLTQIPILGNDQTPNVEELRSTINYDDSDKDGIADDGSDGNFGTVPPLDQLDDLYCEAVGYFRITNAGNYQFRLTADDGAQMFLNSGLIIGNSDFERESAQSQISSLLSLSAGIYPFEIEFWSGTGSPYLLLEWQRPGAVAWEVVPTYDAGSVDDGMVAENTTPVVSEGDKFVYYEGEASGELDQVHPGYSLFTIAGDYDKAYPGEGRPNPADITIEGTTTDFRPQVGSLGFLPDGRLLVATYQPPSHGSAVPADNSLDHKIYSVTGALGDDFNAITVKEVANGLSRPSGMVIVGSDVYLSEIHKIVRLRDENLDGDFLDAGEEIEIIGSEDGWLSTNYHQFTFGLVHLDGYLYGTLSTSIDFGGDALGLNGYGSANRGTWFRVELETGAIEFLAGGLRTPNGISMGPSGRFFATDNQGSWNPANSLYELTEDHFYGHYNLWFQDSATDSIRNPNGVAATGFADPSRQPSTFWDSSVYWNEGETPVYASPYEGNTRRFTRPAIYFPQGDIARSPTQPVFIENQHPSFKGQMFVGELTMGGVRRVFMEEINGRYQGAAFRFTQGLAAGINRVAWAPDGSLFVGGMGPGDNSNWSWRGTWFGLQRLTPNGLDAFEIQTMRAVEDGFILTFTKPVSPTVLSDVSNYGTIESLTYDGQTYVYGAGETALPDLTVTQADPLSDGRSVRLTIPGLIAESVVHLQVGEGVNSSDGEPLWSGEAFYTLNAIPNQLESEWAEWVTVNFSGVADPEVVSRTADPDGDGRSNFEEFIGGGSPSSVDSDNALSIAPSSGSSFEFILRERDSIPFPATVEWESSPDLDEWTPLGGSLELIESTPLGDGVSESRYDYTPPADTPNLFIRRSMNAAE
ncbi:MAG: LamG-like jellyroll fold domain-containing protein [Opitutaceae bacterium]